jgi:hypothetical protein
MKEFLKVFVIMFTGYFALSYFFGSDRDIAGMLFVSGFTALLVALMDRYLRGYMIKLVKKITERYS